MRTLTFGEVPADLTINEPYPMELTASDEETICAAINQGIDSHLEAVHFEDNGIKNNKRCLSITDSKSLRCLVRRLFEDGSDNAYSLASGIMQTLDIEWI